MRRATFQNGGRPCAYVYVAPLYTIINVTYKHKHKQNKLETFLFLMLMLFRFTQLMLMLMLMSHCEPGFGNTYINLGFQVTSSPPCWWTKTKDLSLAPFVRPPAIVHCSIGICVSRDWLQTTNTQSLSSSQRCVLL